MEMSKTITCAGCGYAGETKTILRPQGTHYADLRCPICGKHHGFLSKPANDETKFNRPKAHSELVKKFSKGYCEMCLAKASSFRKGLSLHAHHIVEYKDGGTAFRNNVWILCTGCHSLVHWRRTYIETVNKVAKEVTEWKS